MIAVDLESNWSMVKVTVTLNNVAVGIAVPLPVTLSCTTTRQRFNMGFSTLVQTFNIKCRMVLLGFEVSWSRSQ